MRASAKQRLIKADADDNAANFLTSYLCARICFEWLKLTIYIYRNVDQVKTSGIVPCGMDTFETRGDKSTTVSYIERKQVVKLEGITGCAMMNGLEGAWYTTTFIARRAIHRKMGNN